MRFAWLAGSLLALSMAGGGCSDSGEETDPNDPEGILEAGEFDAEAAQLLRDYRLGPMVWLGEEFEGYRLTRARLSQGGVTLIYGDCDAYKANPREPSCNYPLQIQVKTAGVVPPVETLRPNPPDEYSIDERRGVMVYEHSWNLVVEFGNGQTATILNRVGNNAGLIDALQSANHGTLGVDAVDVGESLEQFTSLPE